MAEPAEPTKPRLVCSHVVVICLACDEPHANCLYCAADLELTEEMRATAAMTKAELRAAQAGVHGELVNDGQRRMVN